MLVITDLTTGAELLRWPMRTSSGQQAQSPHVFWSAASHAQGIEMMVGT